MLLSGKRLDVTILAEAAAAGGATGDGPGAAPGARSNYEQDPTNELVQAGRKKVALDGALARVCT